MFNKKSKEPTINKIPKVKEANKYIFPGAVARKMKTVSMDLQFESSLFASTLLLIGLMLMGIYTFAFSAQTIYLKIIIAINLVGGFIFMGSQMITTYQQYNSYMQVAEMQRSMGMQLPENMQGLLPKAKKNRLNQFLVLLGLIFIIAPWFALKYLWTAIPEYTKYDLVSKVGLTTLGILLIAIVIIRGYMAMKKIKAIIAEAQKQIEVQKVVNVETPKVEVLVQRPIQQIQRPVVSSRPVQQMQPRPVQSQNRPIVQQVQRSVIQNRPTQAIQQQARPVIQQPVQVNKPSLIKRIGGVLRIPNKPQVKPTTDKPQYNKKQIQKINDLDKFFNEKMYEIERLKSSERRY